jgi:hypothetical protein
MSAMQRFSVHTDIFTLRLGELLRPLIAAGVPMQHSSLIQIKLYGNSKLRT